MVLVHLGNPYGQHFVLQIRGRPCRYWTAINLIKGNKSKFNKSPKGILIRGL